MGPAAAFVGASGAWSGFGMTCRVTSAAKAPQVRRAPEGPTAPGTPVGPQATKVGRLPSVGTPSSPAQQGAPSRPATKSAPQQGPPLAGTAAAPLIDARIQAERPASRVAR